MHEYIINLHMHTPYSDGRGSHQEITEAALRAGLDAVIVTDHNVWVQGLEGYWGKQAVNGHKPVLMLVGEEVHDQARQPQKNHLLVFGAGREMATMADDPQRLIHRIEQANGLSFLAHPIDAEAPHFAEEDLSWVDWEVEGFTGIELWNAMTEFKSLLKSRLHALYYAFSPTRVAHGPFEATLKKWDELLAKGNKVVAVGGSDAHAFLGKMGPLRRILFPYEFHFRAVNTHVLTPKPLTGEAPVDRRMILDALRDGHAFVGYDLPASTKGFNFKADCADGTVWMGDDVPAEAGVTLQIKLPQVTEAHLLKDGEILRSMDKRVTLSHYVSEPGIYRVEAYVFYKGKRRGWIFSNPIYVR